MARLTCTAEQQAGDYGGDRQQHTFLGLQVTMTEINAAYNAYAKTGAPPKPCPEFPELQVSYTDFSLWQRGRVQPGGGLECQV